VPKATVGCERLGHLACRMAKQRIEQVGKLGEWEQNNSESRRFNSDGKASLRHIWYGASDCLRQQRLDQLFRFLIPTLTDPNMANSPFLVDKIHRRPVTIAMAIPHRKIVVDGDGETDVVFVDMLFPLR
jgi:hypothetical protein